MLLRGKSVVANQNVSSTISTVSFTDDVVLPCAEYVFRVRAYTSDGFGDFASDLSVTTVPSGK